jgi:hypothetical protein
MYTPTGMVYNKPASLYRICGAVNAIVLMNYNSVITDSYMSVFAGIFDIPPARSSAMFMNYLFQTKASILYVKILVVSPSAINSWKDIGETY